MSERRSGMAAGFATFAAVMMIIAGTFEAFSGLSAVIKKAFYGVSPDYAYKLSISSWGWIHLILGVVTVAAGFALFGGAVWARTVGVILAALVAIANFAYLPWYPIWSIVVITTCIIVIWALTIHGRDIAEDV